MSGPRGEARKAKKTKTFSKTGMCSRLMPPIPLRTLPIFPRCSLILLSGTTEQMSRSEAGGGGGGVLHFFNWELFASLFVFLADKYLDKWRSSSATSERG